MLRTPVDPALAQVAQSGGLVVVGDRGEGAGVGGHGLEHLLQLDRRHAVVVVHHPDLEMLDLAAEGVAQDDQLDERHDHGHDHQGGAAAEAAQVAFDDGPDADHGGSARRGGGRAKLLAGWC